MYSKRFCYILNSRFHSTFNWRWHMVYVGSLSKLGYPQMYGPISGDSVWFYWPSCLFVSGSCHFYYHKSLVLVLVITPAVSVAWSFILPYKFGGFFFFFLYLWGMVLELWIHLNVQIALFFLSYDSHFQMFNSNPWAWEVFLLSNVF